jgi:hypothetical protein
MQTVIRVSTEFARLCLVTLRADSRMSVEFKRSSVPKKYGADREGVYYRTQGVRNSYRVTHGRTTDSPVKKAAP